MKKIGAFFLLLTALLSFVYSSAALNTDQIFSNDAVIFGGYCYYIENGDIYRAPITEMAGETELFREESNGIALEGSTLLSRGYDGEIISYSLACEDPVFNKNLFSFYTEYDEESLLGTLSAKYESNGDPAAISSGNGDAGGASFGAYQFSSNAGVPYAFAKWCISTENSIDIGERLIAAYTEDSNSCGSTFKAEWKEIAAEDSSFFLALQHSYVKEKYYDAIVTRIENNVANFDIDMYGIALKNVFWSRSVQHGVGGSYNVITRAFDSLGGFALQSEEILIGAIYAESGAVSDTGTNPMTGSVAEQYGIAGKYMKYYSKNSSAVQLSVYRRLNINELSEALKMLDTYGGYVQSDDTPFELGNLRTADITDASANLFGTIYNYRLSSITEYGFFIGKSETGLVEIAASGNETTLPVVSFCASTLSYSAELDPMTTYYFGIYAIIDGEYAVSEMSSFITGYATVYTAAFENYDGSILHSVTLREGRMPVYNGKTPAKPADAQYTYAFRGWDKEIFPLTADTVYRACYSETLNTYTVRYFSSDNNTVIYECEVAYGENAVFKGNPPVKAPSRQFRYVFSGWNGNEENITEDCDIHPIFIRQDYLWSQASASGFSGGDGSLESPYLISCGEELAYLSEYTASGRETANTYFALDDNIVLGTKEIPQAFTPIGTSELPFCGVFDGRGYKIIGLTVKEENEAGLFGAADGAEIKNLIIEDANIEGDLSGIIVGKLRNTGNNLAKIENCKVSGNVNGKSYAGLAVGYAEGKNIALTNTASCGILRGKVCGGICGYFGGESIACSFADAIITGEIGGSICGSKDSASTVTNCYFTADGMENGIGEAIDADKLQNKESYKGFDFEVIWIIKNNKADLYVSSENAFSYCVYGDADENGKLNSKDIILLTQYIAGWGIELSDKAWTASDVVKDATLNTKDVVKLAQFIAEWDVVLGE